MPAGASVALIDEQTTKRSSSGSRRSRTSRAAQLRSPSTRRNPRGPARWRAGCRAPPPRGSRRGSVARPHPRSPATQHVAATRRPTSATQQVHGGAGGFERAHRRDPAARAAVSGARRPLFARRQGVRPSSTSRRAPCAPSRGDAQPDAAESTGHEVRRVGAPFRRDTVAAPLSAGTEAQREALAVAQRELIARHRRIGGAPAASPARSGRARDPDRSCRPTAPRVLRR